MARDWVQVAGNHERQVLATAPEGLGPSDAWARAHLSSEALAWVAALEPTHGLSEEVFLCHGTPARDDEHLLAVVEPEGLRLATPRELEARLGSLTAALVCCGHTHLPHGLHTARGQLVVNPGSVGLQAYVDSAPHAYVVENGTPQASYAILERRSGGWHADWIRVPYDPGPMAALARTRGFPRWEAALLTGRLPQDT
jgi:predicted phosphodiesterase